MLRLEPRPVPSRVWSYGAPVIALAMTVVVGTALFAALGYFAGQLGVAYLREPIWRLRVISAMSMWSAARFADPTARPGFPAGFRRRQPVPGASLWSGRFPAGGGYRDPASPGG